LPTWRGYPIEFIQTSTISLGLTRKLRSRLWREHGPTIAYGTRGFGLAQAEP
jgi:hypothetical protein